jgi:hypothetical protein
MITIIYWINEAFTYLALFLILFSNNAFESENINQRKYIKYIILCCGLVAATSLSLGSYISGSIWLVSFSIWTYFYINTIE